MRILEGASAAVVVALAALLPGCGTAVAAGPFDGDLVSLDGDTVAEVLANEDTGEVMVHMWDSDLRTPRPVEAKSMRIGAPGSPDLELVPHPTETDPAGFCSRFYGSADWVKHRAVSHGWLSLTGHGRRDFAWERCWEGGRRHGGMWSEMGRHQGMHGMHGSRER